MLLAALAVFGTTAFADSTMPPAEIKIEINSGLLSVEARKAPLSEILEQIGRSAGFKTNWIADKEKSPRLDVSFKAVSVSKAVERLVDDTNRLIFYQTRDATTGHKTISQVWILGYYATSSDSDLIELGNRAQADDLQHQESKTRSEAALGLVVESYSKDGEKTDTERVRLRLIQLLQEDKDALVRSRAAIALGALKDEESIDALEAALLDDSGSVRAQVINALGQIGGDRAADALGSILLYNGNHTTDRVMAAQALWMHGTESAREYLDLGAVDQNKQVRVAASKPPLKPKKVRNTEKLGSEETQ